MSEAALADEAPWQTRWIAPNRAYLGTAAREIVAFLRQHAVLDWSQACVVLPNQLLAPSLAQALQAAVGTTVFVPTLNTFSGCVEPWLAGVPHMSEVRRQSVLFAQLRRRAWFADAALWDVVAELTAVFDALTDAAVRLPQDEAALAAQLGRAFALQASAPLAFEARVVATLWQAESQGALSRSAARWLAAVAWLAALRGPLIWLAEGPLTPPQQALLAAAQVPVLVLQANRDFVGERADSADAGVARALAAAWPVGSVTQPLQTRLGVLSDADLALTRQRTRWCLAESLEGLAHTVVTQVCAWLAAGKRDIVLVAADRLATRRARALLERVGVLVADEMGWKLSTTRAAASVDALLEVIASDAWHASLTHVLDAPLLFADLSTAERLAAREELETLCQSQNLRRGLAVMLEALPTTARAARGVLLRLTAAQQALRPQTGASLAAWLQRLRAALEAVGAWSALAQDAAGEAWLNWWSSRQAELGVDTAEADVLSLRFSLWRSWFNREMDAALFRDRSITSPVVISHLAACRLRRFEAAIVVGADAAHLGTAPAPGWLAHAGVRAELGLPSLELARGRLREDLAGLVLSCDEVVFAWQHHEGDEEVLPAADIALALAAFSPDKTGSADWREYMLTPGHVSEALASARMAPSVPRAAVPGRLSPSALQTLWACPYRYFAGYVLGLSEREALEDALQKRDYGERLHAVLYAFHRQFPQLTGLPRERLEAALWQCCEAEFQADVSRNFLDHAWWLKAREHLAAYIDWQLAREAEGWRWQMGEAAFERNLPLDDGSVLLLRGRIDRIDQHVREAGKAVLDYKARKLSDLKRQANDAEDVQLAFYSLLVGDDVQQSAYVALEEGLQLAVQDEAAERASNLAEEVTQTFDKIHQGAHLPAHGAASVCGYCEMRGLCRRDWVA